MLRIPVRRGGAGTEIVGAVRLTQVVFVAAREHAGRGDQIEIHRQLGSDVDVGERLECLSRNEWNPIAGLDVDGAF